MGESPSIWKAASSKSLAAKKIANFDRLPPEIKEITDVFY
jgi:hypothetical protein